MVSLGGSFFTKDGIVSDEALLKKQIYEELKAFVTAGLSKKVSGLLEVLRMECCVESLVMLDDDMKMEALTQTNNIKAIVTAELPMDLERKGQQSYQADMRVRFLALGNGRMQALHDRSYGFFRRQILLEAKERPPDRRDDPYLAQRLCAEKESIFLWAFAGLQRLVANDFHFTLSQQAQENMAVAIAEGNNLVEFMKSEGYFLFQADSEVSSRDFYAVYLQWCMDNALSPLAQKTVINYLKQNSRQYKLEYTNKISIGDGRLARGFWGIQLLKK